MNEGLAADTLTERGVSVSLPLVNDSGEIEAETTTFCGGLCVFNSRLGKGAQEKGDSATNVVWVLGARQESLFLSPYQGRERQLGCSLVTITQHDSAIALRFPIRDKQGAPEDTKTKMEDPVS